MRKTLLRLALPVLAAAAILVVISTSSDGPRGERTAAAAEPVVDPSAPSARVPRRPYAILLALDEFPADSLLGRGGRIDAVRYPNLAALAENGYWFPNASTVYDSTPKAQPLILDGKRPRPGPTSDFHGHPRTLFDMFGRRGYRVVASEEATAVCPPRWCRGATGRKPDSVGNLKGGRVERLERFFGRIRPGRPTFWYKHVLLPHGPYMYLPSGARTRRGARDLVPGENSTRGFDDRYVTLHNEQRYLLQLQFVDRELGKLFRRLVRLGMFDKTLIAITADHGFAFEVGAKDRRKVTNRNVDEVAPVPLFIKAPGQRRGRIDRSYVRTLDIAPTIADILNFRLPYRADGRSAFTRATRRRRLVRLPTRDFSRIVRISARRYERRRRAIISRRLRLFGAGSSGLFGAIGPARDLVGRQLADLRVVPGGRVRARVAGAATIQRVRRSSGVVPAEIAGDVRGRGRGRRRAIAVAVNGRIEATGESFFLKRDRTEHFAVNVPESALREGANRVEVFEVGRGRVLRRLASV